MVKWLALVAGLLASCDAAHGVVLVLAEASVTEAGAADAGSSEVDASENRADASDPALSDGSMPADDARASDAGTIAIASACRIAGASSGFFEEFAGDTLDESRFLVAHGAATLAGRAPQGGFVRENVGVRDGALVLRVRGDGYGGPVRGIDANGTARSDGRRSGAAVATRDLFASATYSATLDMSGPPGVELAMFVARDDASTERLEMASAALSDGILDARVRILSERADGLGGQSELPLAANGDGRALHTLRFDWYTHAPETVRFWSDDVAHVDRDQRAPDGRAGRLWILAWVREEASAPFDTVELRVERAFITPFANRGDRCADSLAPALLSSPRAGVP